MEASPVVTQYLCSACGTQVSSEGTEAIDHMVTNHGVDPEGRPDENTPYLIPVESNPTLDDNGVPV